MDEFAAESGHAQRVSAGVDVAQLETAIELDVRAMRVIETIHIGQFDPVVVKREGRIAAQLSSDCGNYP
jgi:hypothetical protein